MKLLSTPTISKPQPLPDQVCGHRTGASPGPGGARDAAAVASTPRSGGQLRPGGDQQIHQEKWDFTVNNRDLMRFI